MSTVQSQPGRILSIIAGGAIVSGAVQEIGSDIIGVALNSAAASGDVYPLATEGVFTVAKKTSQTWAAGDKLYWDTSAATASNAYVAAAADNYIGLATAIAASAATTGNCKLRGGAEAEVDLDDVVLKSLFDAETILIATSDNTPIPLTVSASTIVGRGAAGSIVALTPAQARVVAATTSEAEGDELLGAGTVGADRLVAAQLTGLQSAVVADDNLTGGMPVIHTFVIPTTAATTPFVFVHKTRIAMLQALKTVAAGTAAGTLTIKNGSTAITDAAAWDNNTVDKAIVAFGTIDDGQHTIAAGGTLNITTDQNASDGILTVIGFRVT